MNSCGRQIATPTLKIYVGATIGRPFFVENAKKKDIST